VLLVLDRPGGEARAEEVTRAAVADVEPLRMAPAQVLHARAEAGDGGLHDEVVVVRHQAEGVDAPAVAGDGLGKEAEEGAAVVVVPGDVDAADAARGDVEVAVRELGAEDPWHNEHGKRTSRRRGHVNRN
jgi:hypothetical protein